MALGKLYIKFIFEGLSQLRRHYKEMKAFKSSISALMDTNKEIKRKLQVAQDMHDLNILLRRLPVGLREIIQAQHTHIEVDGVDEPVANVRHMITICEAICHTLGVYKLVIMGYSFIKIGNVNYPVFRMPELSNGIYELNIAKDSALCAKLLSELVNKNEVIIEYNSEPLAVLGVRFETECGGRIPICIFEMVTEYEWNIGKYRSVKP